MHLVVGGVHQFCNMQIMHLLVRMIREELCTAAVQNVKALTGQSEEAFPAMDCKSCVAFRKKRQPHCCWAAIMYLMLATHKSCIYALKESTWAETNSENITKT